MEPSYPVAWWRKPHAADTGARVPFRWWFETSDRHLCWEGSRHVIGERLQRKPARERDTQSELTLGGLWKLQLLLEYKSNKPAMVLAVCAHQHAAVRVTHVCVHEYISHTSHTFHENIVERTSPSLPHLCCERPVSGFLCIFLNTSEMASEFELSFHLNVCLTLKTIKRQYILQWKYFIFNFNGLSGHYYEIRKEILASQLFSWK